MADDVLRVGIIGASAKAGGWAARAHLPALSKVRGVELTAVCTSRQESAEESAKLFGARLAFHDHREMLRRPDIDAVGVVVGAPQHHKLTMDCLRAGKHVFTEWPLGISTAEAEEMADMARRQGVHTMVGLQGRYSAELIHVKRLIDEGFVGEVLAVHMSLLQQIPGALSRAPGRLWQRHKSMGGSILNIQFAHDIDSLCMVLGEFETVSAIASTQIHQWRVEGTDEIVDVDAPDDVLLSGRLRSGALVSAHVATLPWHGSGYRTEVYGLEGTLVIEASGSPHVEPARVLGGRASDPALHEIPVPQESWVTEAGLPNFAINIAKAWRSFAECITRGDPAGPDFDDAVARHRFIDAVQRASDTGQAQAV